MLPAVFLQRNRKHQKIRGTLSVIIGNETCKLKKAEGETKMRKTAVLSIFLAGTGLLAACSSGEEGEAQAWLEEDWEAINAEADGSDVRMFMWGGDDGLNQYMDEYVIPTVEQEHNIDLERVPIDTEESLQRLLTEKEAGEQEGTMDILWLNGENFRAAKENELLLGSFTEKLPHFNEYIDADSPETTLDFGTPTEGMESPLGKVQFTFIYDTEKVDQPPATWEELRLWAEDNPGEFTYPEATDFTGNAFLRQLLYDQYGNDEAFASEAFDEEALEENTEPMWDYLNELEGSLWREGQTYPASVEELDRLYSRGEVSMTMGYNEARAESLIRDGTFPETTDTFMLDSGSIGNTHFLTMPFNAGNPAGAMVVMDFLLSPEAQIEKMNPDGWGESSVLDPALLTEEDRRAMEAVDRGASVPSQEELDNAYLPELDADYVGWLEEKWNNEVVQP